MRKSIQRNLHLQSLAVIDLLGFLQDLPEGNGLPVLLDFLQAGSPAVRQHEVGLSDAEFLLFLSRFHSA